MVGGGILFCGIASPGTFLNTVQILDEIAVPGTQSFLLSCVISDNKLCKIRRNTN